MRNLVFIIFLKAIILVLKNGAKNHYCLNIISIVLSKVFRSKRCLKSGNFYCVRCNKYKRFVKRYKWRVYRYQNKQITLKRPYIASLFSLVVSRQVQNNLFLECHYLFFCFHYPLFKLILGSTSAYDRSDNKMPNNVKIAVITQQP
jgi:hypothetical protein